MSEQFKVGDVVVGHSFTVNIDYNDMEGVIEFGLEERAGVNPIISIQWSSQCYMVRWKDGHLTQADPKNLRKKRPPESDEAAHRQAMLDCIERAKMGMGAHA